MAQRNGAPDKSTDGPPVSSPSTSTATAAADDNDLGGVQRLRRAEVIDPDAVPPTPPGISPVEADEQRGIARVSGGNVAELLTALDHVAKNPSACEGSPHTPERAGRIAARIRKAIETESRLDRAATVTRQQRFIAVGDGHAMIVDLADDAHRAAKRDPAITQRHAPIVAYAALPAEAVKKGIARTRAAKAKAAKKAPAQQPVSTPPDSDKPKG